ncbi:InlB B-repeat-containing protein [Candidatus Aalborgicola defluviihabitans]|uniref:InlB B-repeat-containing protein n=1 Tax=Candidatus Aalborgicola defluviihabitans TaxID=3386187 RepID=UPI001EC38726|nr:hypothetical protein [Burkholderiales bacterium]
MTSSPVGINCGATCSASFADGASVTLTAMPDAGNTFTGWSGDCTGTGSCVLSMGAARSVGAAFTAITPVSPEWLPVSFTVWPQVRRHGAGLGQ